MKLNLIYCVFYLSAPSRCLEAARRDIIAQSFLRNAFKLTTRPLESNSRTSQTLIVTSALTTTSIFATTVRSGPHLRRQNPVCQRWRAGRGRCVGLGALLRTPHQYV